LFYLAKIKKTIIKIKIILKSTTFDFFRYGEAVSFDAKRRYGEAVSFDAKRRYGEAVSSIKSKILYFSTSIKIPVNHIRKAGWKIVSRTILIQSTPSR